MELVNTTLAKPNLGTPPNDDPYQGYLDLFDFKGSYEEQIKSLFAGDPPLISTPQGKGQFQQILSMLNIMASYCSHKSETVA